MSGDPGSIASTWQRAGRAGRRSGSSCAVFVASSAPLDQFIVQHPDYFFGSSPEHAHIQPDNLEILVNHLKCAAFELPISPDERFGSVDLPELCEQLGDAGFLHQSGGDWHWIDEAYLADTISLRSVTSDNFVIIDTTGEDTGKPDVIGEVDFSSALTTVHPKAIYIPKASSITSSIWISASAKPVSSQSTWTIPRMRSVTPRFACSKSPKKKRLPVQRLACTATCSCDRRS